MTRPARTPAKRCSRCGQPLLPGALRALRVCGACIGEEQLFPTEALLDLSAAELDELPFGVVELDPDGVILSYNRGEERLSGRSRRDVVGHNFFTEVAPCTNVRDFAGAYRDMVEAGVAAEQDLEFVFHFAHGSTLVHVQLVYSAVARVGFILVKRRA